MPASSTTGDIIWKWRDPKTVELYNVNPEPAPAPEESAPASPFGKHASDQELMQQMMIGKSRAEMARDAPPEQKRAWRKQLNRFLRNERISDPMEFDREQGIQEMIDSGAAWY